MGQYHVLVNYDKKEIVEPYGLGLGAKQVEMTSPNAGGGDLPLTSVSGRWAGDRVMIVGDYTEDSNVPSIPNASQLYGAQYTDITDEVAVALKVAFRRNVRESGWHPDYVDKEETNA